MQDAESMLKGNRGCLIYVCTFQVVISYINIYWLVFCTRLEKCCSRVPVKHLKGGNLLFPVYQAQFGNDHLSVLMYPSLCTILRGICYDFWQFIKMFYNIAFRWQLNCNTLFPSQMQTVLLNGVQISCSGFGQVCTLCCI